MERVSLKTKFNNTIRSVTPVALKLLVRIRRGRYKGLCMPVQSGGIEDGRVFVIVEGVKYFGYPSDRVDQAFYSYCLKKEISSKIPKECFALYLDVSKRFWMQDRTPLRSNIDAYSRVQGSGAILEIGAYLGLHAVYQAKRFSSNSIYAFEPSKENFELCSLNAACYDNLHALNFAVSDKVESAAFTRNNQQIGSLLADSVIGKTSEQVDTITIDEFISRNNIAQVALIRIQVNGAELRALEGALDTIKKNHPVMIVTSKYLAQDSFTRLKTRLFDFGYECNSYGDTHVFFAKPFDNDLTKREPECSTVA